MPTVISHTVDVGGTGDYTTLQAWETAQQRNLVTADEIAKAVCINTGTSADGTAGTIGGWTSDATRYVWVTGESDPHGGAWNTGTYYMQLSTTAAALTVTQANTLVEFIQVNNTNNNGEGVRWDVTGTVNAAIIKTTGTGNGSYGLSHDGTTTTANFRNCIVYGFANTNGIVARGPATTGDKVYNCTVYGCATGYSSAGSSTFVKNCIANNCTTDFSGTWHGDSDYNCDEDGTGPGANTQTGTVTFAGAEDFHLATADAVARGNGVDLSGDTTNPVVYDIDGETRSFFDIGADENLTAAGTRRIFTIT